MNIKGKLGLVDQVGEGLEWIGEWGGGGGDMLMSEFIRVLSLGLP